MWAADVALSYVGLVFQCWWWQVGHGVGEELHKLWGSPSRFVTKWVLATCFFGFEWCDEWLKSNWNQSVDWNKKSVPSKTLSLYSKLVIFSFLNFGKDILHNTNTNLAGGKLPFSNRRRACTFNICFPTLHVWLPEKSPSYQLAIAMRILSFSHWRYKGAKVFFRSISHCWFELNEWNQQNVPF